MNEEREVFEAEPIETNGRFGDRFKQSKTQELAVAHDPEHSALDMQIATAKHYPRSISTFKRDALGMATLDEETATSCFFSMPRGGKAIEGPSVRLAEICASAWGHINAQAVISDIGDVFVTARAVCWDMEKNLRIGFEVRRRITKKNGQRYDDDMIGVTCGAAMSIALRNAIFRVIPRAYVDSIYREARKVAIGDAKTLSSKRVAMVDYFAKMGINPARVLAAVEAASVEDITLDNLAVLKGYATAIKDGEASIETCFPEPKKADEKPQGLADKIKSNGKKAEAEKSAEAKKEEPAAPVAEKPKEEAKPAEVEGEIPNEEAPATTDAPMTDEEKAAAATQEAVQEASTWDRQTLLDKIQSELMRLGKKSYGWAAIQSGVGKSKSADMTDAELRMIYAKVFPMTVAAK